MDKERRAREQIGIVFNTKEKERGSKIAGKFSK